MKEFTTAAKESMGGDEDYLEFSVDGRVIKAFRPTDGQIAVTMSSFGRRSTEMEQTAAVIDFFVEILEEDAQQYIVDRLMSRSDPMSLDQVQEIVEYLVEEWVGRPTQSPSGSTRSRTPGGQRSKPPTQRSTSSRSVPASS